MRVWKQNSSGTMYFLYDGTQPVCEYDGRGALTATSTFGADGLVSRHSVSAGSTAFYTQTPFGPWTKARAASLAAQHVMYHDGQLNSLHLRHGDTEMHWG